MQLFSAEAVNAKAPEKKRSVIRPTPESAWRTTWFTVGRLVSGCRNCSPLHAASSTTFEKRYERRTTRMKNFIKALWQEEDGQDLVEYALILGFIALAAVGVLTSTSTAINTVWTNIDTKLGTAAS
jgi:Flp pilus assembly pilin Flp